MQRRYKRYFIILETEDKESGVVKSGNPKGHGKIEVKNNEGRLTINCVNLKKRSSAERYRWYLINTNKEEEPKIVEIGPMEVDEKGKGEVVWEFNAENVRGSMELIDDFNVLVLTVQNKDNKNNLFVPLIGHMDKEKSTSWRYALEKYLYIPTTRGNKQKPQPKKEQKQKPEPKPKKEEKLKEELNTEKQKEQKSNIKEEIKEIEKVEPKEEIKEEKIESKKEIKEEDTGTNLDVDVNKDLDSAQDINKETIEDKEENKQFDSEEYIENIWDDKDREFIPIKERPIEEKITEEPLNLEEPLEFSAQMQGYIENALGEFPEVEPFYNNIEGFTWWQIPHNHQTMYRSYMPFILYVDSLKEPADYERVKMLESISYNKHHIFGVLYDQDKNAKCYAYGILARNTPSEQPYEGATGFKRWYPCDPEPHDLHSYGYWILKIDPKTGRVIEE